MFSKSSSKPAVSGPTEPAKVAAPSIISEDLKIVGDLHSAGEIQVDGRVDGDVRTNALLIGESAVIKGEIVADSVIVHGTVNGQIKASSVKLAKTSRVTGDILHEDLAIEKGAFLEGHCKRMSAEQAKETPAAAKEAAQASSQAARQGQPAAQAATGGQQQPGQPAKKTPAAAG